MKILLDARLYGLENTGIGRYLINLIDGLNEIDEKNKYVVLLRKKYYQELNLGKNWKKIRADYRHYSFAEQIFLPGLIKKENPDLTHFPHFNIPALWKGKFVVTIHDMTMHFQKTEATTLFKPLFLIKRLAYKYLFRAAVERSVKIITPSKSVKNQLVKYFNIPDRKVVKIYEGIEKLSNSLDGINVVKKYGLPGKYFLYVGDLYPHKNIKTAIDAINDFNKNIDQEVPLILVSARSIFSDRLQKYANGIGASRYIRLLGFVPDKDLSTIFKYSTGFVFPSLSEGFGLPGLEAMSAGTIVISSKIDVLKEIYSDFAIYFDPDNYHTLSAAMKYVFFLSESDRKLIIDKSAGYINKFSWKKMTQETLNLYESCFSL